MSYPIFNKETGEIEMKGSPGIVNGLLRFQKDKYRMAIPEDEIEVNNTPVDEQPKKTPVKKTTRTRRKKAAPKK